MKSLFGIDGPVATFFTKLFDLILLSVVWVILSLPLVTMGAATAAAYAVVTKYVRREEGRFWQTFWKTFAEHWKHHTGTWAIALVGLMLLGASAYGLRVMHLSGNPAGALYWVMLFLIGVYVTWTLYLGAYVALIEGGTRDVLRLSFMMVILHPVRALMNVALVIAGVAIVLAVPYMLIFVPGVLFFLTSFQIIGAFVKHMPEEEAEALLPTRSDKKENS